MCKTKGKKCSTKKKEKLQKKSRSKCQCVIIGTHYSNGERIFVQKPRCARILVSPSALSYTLSGSIVIVMLISRNRIAWMKPFAAKRSWGSSRRTDIMMLL